MTDQKFLYTTYIRTTPEKAFKALVESEFTRKYWESDNVSDWKPGSPWQHMNTATPPTTRIVGEVIEYDPPRRLVLTWAWPGDAADKLKHSRVTIEIAPVEDMVCLTVTHEDFKGDEKMIKGISNGWPRVLCSLKSLLETGKPLSTFASLKK